MKSTSGTAEAFLLGMLIVAASIIRGGNRQIAIALLLLISLALLSVILADLAARRFKNSDYSVNHQSRAISNDAWRHVLLGIVLLAPIYIGIFQTTPTSPQVWEIFSLSAFAPPIRDALPSWALPMYPAYSSVPDASITSALCGLVVSITLWATIRLRAEFLYSIVFLWIFVAIIQVVMVAAQIAGGPGSWAYFGSDFQQYKFIGTFNSRNTLGGFFAACMPLVVWHCMFQNQRATGYTRVRRVIMSFDLAALAAIIMLIFGMQSRGGLLAFTTSATTMVVIIWMARSSELESSRRFVPLVLGLGLVFSLVAMLLVGWETVSQRFRVEEVARPILFGTAWDGAIELLPFGAGLGTFGAIYQKFQPVELVGYFSLAHNDYIQYVFELGFLGIPPIAALIALLLATFVVRRPLVNFSVKLNNISTLRQCAMASLLGLALHSTVEFNMHIPALAMLGAFLVGIIIKPLWSDTV